MLSNKENLNKCIRDLRKIIDSEEVFSKLEVLKNTYNTETLINYALDNGLIRNLEDVFYIVTEIPEISEKMANCILNSSKKEMLIGITHNGCTVNSDDYRYSGTYNSLNEVPGYGHEWNERCIPSGVVIRGRNTGGCRC